jgi:hypothetical protein
MTIRDGITITARSAPWGWKRCPVDFRPRSSSAFGFTGKMEPLNGVDQVVEDVVAELPGVPEARPWRRSRLEDGVQAALPFHVPSFFGMDVNESVRQGLRPKAKTAHATIVLGIFQKRGSRFGAHMRDGAGAKASLALRSVFSTLQRLARCKVIIALGSLRQMTLRALRCDGRVPRKALFALREAPLPDGHSRRRDGGSQGAIGKRFLTPGSRFQKAKSGNVFATAGAVAAPRHNTDCFLREQYRI